MKISTLKVHLSSLCINAQAAECWYEADGAAQGKAVAEQRPKHVCTTSHT